MRDMLKVQHRVSIHFEGRLGCIRKAMKRHVFVESSNKDSSTCRVWATCNACSCLHNCLTMVSRIGTCHEWIMCSLCSWVLRHSPVESRSGTFHEWSIWDVVLMSVSSFKGDMSKWNVSWVTTFITCLICWHHSMVTYRNETRPGSLTYTACSRA